MIYLLVLLIYNPLTQKPQVLDFQAPGAICHKLATTLDRRLFISSATCFPAPLQYSRAAERQKQ
jgi:hypothetical protein